MAGGLLQVLRLLLGCCDAEEECAHVVAECLGHLALLAPDAVLPVLQVLQSPPCKVHLDSVA